MQGRLAWGGACSWCAARLGQWACWRPLRHLKAYFQSGLPPWPAVPAVSRHCLHTGWTHIIQLGSVLQGRTRSTAPNRGRPLATMVPQVLASPSGAQHSLMRTCRRAWSPPPQSPAAAGRRSAAPALSLDPPPSLWTARSGLRSGGGRCGRLAYSRLDGEWAGPTAGQTPRCGGLRPPTCCRAERQCKCTPHTRTESLVLVQHSGSLCWCAQLTTSHRPAPHTRLSTPKRCRCSCCRPLCRPRHTAGPG